MKKMIVFMLLILGAFDSISQPANDEPCNALVLPIIESADGCTPVVYNITGASFSNVPGTLSCNNSPDVWLKFNTPDQLMKLRFGGSNVVFTTYTYSSCSSNLSDILTCIDSTSWAGFGNNIAFLANTDQLIRVESINGSPNFSFSICLTILHPGSNQRVGINTKFPQANFDVAGKAVFRDTLSISNVLRFNNGTQGPNQVLTSDNNGYAFWGNPPTNYWTTSGSHIYNNNSGNIGIGIAAPSSKLDVNGQVVIEQKNFGGYGGLLIKGNVPGNNHPNIGFSVKNNSNNDVVAAMIQGDLLNTLPGSETIDLAFYTSQAGQIGLAERLRIKNNGNVGIGTNNPSSPLSFPPSLSKKISLYPGSSGDVGMSVSGNDFRIYSDNINAKISFGYDDYVNGFISRAYVPASGAVAMVVQGQLNVNGTIYNSDVRYKKNIRTIPAALSVINNLRGVQYEMRSLEFPSQHFDNRTQVGLVAQEVENVIPQLVYTNSEGYKSVDYAKLVPILIEGTKEQQKQIEKLKKELNELKQLVQQLLNNK